MFKRYDYAREEFEHTTNQSCDTWGSLADMHDPERAARQARECGGRTAAHNMAGYGT